MFSNIPQTVKGSEPADDDLPVIQAALRTSAAPTLFPLHEGHADGLYAGLVFVKSRHSCDIHALTRAPGFCSWLLRNPGPCAEGQCCRE